MQNSIAFTMLALLAVLFVACGSNPDSSYDFGDVSRAYCGSTSPAYRENLRVLALAAGVPMVDYCLAVGVPLVVLTVVQDAKAAKAAEVDSTPE